ncbi:MAG TPA: SGNH/GDSL hydrolase family protein [Alphaproteobacteria bacterium]
MKRLSDLVQDPSGVMRRALVAAAWALAFGLAALPARSETLAAQSSCAVPHDLLRSTNKLPRVAKKLQRGEAIKVVAFGSSSTAGIGASSPKATYPSQFRAELQRLFPHSKITIVNKGVAGEDVMEMLGRFQRDVLDEHPDLLIWQTGTNSALHRNKVSAYSGRLTQGIDQAHAAGIDVLLMGPQFSPKFEAVPNHHAFLDHIATIASVRRVPVLPRYQIMKYWLDSGQMTEPQMVNPDGLHQTDRSYHCLGVVAAEMVAGLAEHPTMAGVPVAHKAP